MPTRLLRDGILESRAVNSLSLAGEVFYRRLMSAVDDYGRFEADATLLRARLFPLQLDRWKEKDIDRVLLECAATKPNLIELYQVGNKQFLQINNFGQRIQSQKSKYPAPDGTKPETRETEGKVYFIQGEQSKRIKIGYTEWEPDMRLLKLQTGSSEKLILLGYLPGTRKVEAALHAKFAHLSLVGEWFSPAPELIAEVSNHFQNFPTVETRENPLKPAKTETETETETNAEAKPRAGVLRSADAETPKPQLVTDSVKGTRFTEPSMPKPYLDFAVEQMGFTPVRALAVYEKFADHFRAKAGQTGRKLDWLATWRNWCREEVQRQPPRSGMLPFQPREGIAEQMTRVVRERIERGERPI